LTELNSYEIGIGKSKKMAKSEAAKKSIEMIAHIPDVQSAIIQIMLTSNMNEGNLIMQHTTQTAGLLQDWRKSSTSEWGQRSSENSFSRQVEVIPQQH
jgi:hypothetical protein